MIDRRNLYVDFVKYFTIFCVVWGHVIQQTCLLKNPNYDYIYRLIYTFHMPLFMGLCGYFFAISIAKYGLGDYIKIKLKKRILGLLVPMLSFGLLITILRNDIGIVQYFQTVHDVWFLGDLIINTIAVALIFRLCNGKLSHDVRYFILGMPFTAVPKIEYGGQGLYMYIFFVLGFLLFTYYKYDLSLYINRWKLPLFIFALVFFIWDISPLEPSGIIFIKEELFRSCVVFLFKVILGVTGVYLVLVFLYKIFPFVKKHYVVNLFIKRGRYTLDIYLLQIIIVEIYGGKLYRELLSHLDYNVIFEYGIVVEFILSFIVTCLMMEIVVFVDEFINKHKYMSKLLFYR